MIYLKKQIIDLENSYKFLNNDRSPSKIVGFKPSKNFEKVKHKVSMLSLGNAFNEEDLNSFEKKIFNFLSIDKIQISIDYSAEPKIDGISASLIYINGKFIKGLSRGDGVMKEKILLRIYKLLMIFPRKINEEKLSLMKLMLGEKFL